jgi:hypothetical protein
MTEQASALQLELTAMRNARVEDHKLCAKLSDDNKALVEKVAFLGDRLAACNRDIGQLSAALEAARDLARDIIANGHLFTAPMLERVNGLLPSAERRPTCAVCRKPCPMTDYIGRCDWCARAQEQEPR